MSDLQNRIKQLKQEKNAVILAHYYVHDEVQEIADYIGDSFYLSKVATKTDADTIVFCGVSFMGESAKILNPEKTVLMPDETADCPMAHMADIDRIEELRKEYPDLAVVCYINSTAELKCHADVCVTSSNAIRIVKALPNKNIFFIPDEKLVFSEADIMRGIAFAERYASQNNRPMVVCLALGCNNGSHNGTENLCEYIDGITSERGRTVVVGAGNEANARHHYQGSTTAKPADVEINVEKDMRGMYVECWSLAPELFTISIISPGGQSNPAGIPVQPQSGNYDFLLEGTKVTIDYSLTGRSSRDLLAFIRMENVVKGVWTIRFYPVKTINGIFHLWLPMNNMLEGDVTFIVSDPQTTITMPSDAKAVITAGGYNSINDSIYIESGRGFDSNGFYKPDLAAPAVNISGVDTRGNYILSSGTSAAAAITAGVCALGLELFTNRILEDSTNGLDIKNALIRDCRRKDGTDYPNKTTGYGYLNGIANL